ncbi:MAG: hypothetical protein VB128_09680 [Sedimentibacter saalensis]|jgi:hypothetical protein|uniref:hypothetical protein n=1 Tax=Sedimentibacter saalensis TaxID=130788 RepID=UPI002B211DB2|nr:hypothetical protein [Sedimentibacter saalensis]MEA5095212.1 hypothetical protein [Sedimentibacter saalensis]
MSISKVGYHYFTKSPGEVIKQLKKAETFALANTADSSTRLFLTNNYPKVLVIVYKYMVSAFPFSPQLGQHYYMGWLNFNSRKNSYAQKYGSLFVLEDNSNSLLPLHHIELWKDGRMIQLIDLEERLKVTEDEAKAFIKLIYSMLYPNESLQESNLTQTNGGVNLELFEKALVIPLLYPTNWSNQYKLLEETQFMQIVESP